MDDTFQNIKNWSSEDLKSVTSLIVQFSFTGVILLLNHMLEEFNSEERKVVIDSIISTWRRSIEEQAAKELKELKKSEDSELGRVNAFLSSFLKVDIPTSSDVHLRLDGLMADTEKLIRNLLIK